MSAEPAAKLRRKETFGRVLRGPEAVEAVECHLRPHRHHRRRQGEEEVADLGQAVAHLHQDFLLRSAVLHQTVPHQVVLHQAVHHQVVLRRRHPRADATEVAETAGA